MKRASTPGLTVAIVAGLVMALGATARAQDPAPAEDVLAPAPGGSDESLELQVQRLAREM